MADWLERINEARKVEQPWRTAANNAIKAYKRAESRSAFNVLWPNTEIKRAALFARVPAPIVDRRFASDPLTGKVSLMLERALEYQNDIQPTFEIWESIVLDWVLAGRGVPRVRYMPSYIEREEELLTDGEGRYYNDMMVEVTSDEIIIRENDQVVRSVREVVGEETPIERVKWDQFTHDPQPVWSDVEWTAFHHRMTESSAVKAFGKSKAADLVEITAAEAKMMGGSSNERSTSLERRLSVWEVWDRNKAEVLFVGDAGRSGAKILEKYDDPAKLKNFYPIPKPLIAVDDPDSTVPIVEYELYREQAEEVNLATKQIKRLLRQVRVKGGYDASMPQLRDLARIDENVLVPIENMLATQGVAAIKDMIAYLPFTEAANAAAILTEYRRQQLDLIYQIVGLSDIMRGSSDPRETAAAQNIKSKFGGLRLSPQQQRLQHTIVETMELQVELMSEKFDLDTLMAMTRVEVPPEAEVILRNDVTRQFAIDIESDSTLAMDEQQQKQERIEFLNAFTDILGRSREAQAAGVLNQQAVAEVVKFALKPYRISRELEDVIDQMGQEQPQQQDPEAAARMMEQQLKSQELQLKEAAMQQEGAIEAQKLQLQAAKFAHDAEVDEGKLFLEALKVG